MKKILGGYCIVVIMVLSLGVTGGAQTCNSYMLDGHKVVDCGNYLSIDGSARTQSGQNNYAERTERAIAQNNAEINRKHQIAVEERRIEVLGRLEQLSAPEIQVSSSSFSGSSLKNRTNLISTISNTSDITNTSSSTSASTNTNTNTQSQDVEA